MPWKDINPRRGPGGDFDEEPEFKLPGLNLPRGFWSRTFNLVIIGVVALVILIALGVYKVNLGEVGVVKRFGKLNRIVNPGLHYRIPFIEEVATPKVEEAKREEIGFRTIDPGPPAKYQDVPKESLMLTGDENIIDIDVIVQYRIKDAAAYLFNVREQQETVRNAAEAAIREIIGNRTIDEALTTGKTDIQNSTRELLQQILDKYNSGIVIEMVQLQDVHPPQQVFAAFRDVASAREDRNRLINEAQGYRNDIIPKAEGAAAEIIQQAEAYKQERINRALGDVTRFRQILAEYQKAKEITKLRLYLETMDEILPGIEKYIIDETSQKGLLPILQLSKEEYRKDENHPVGTISQERKGGNP
jgi:membrane protease subunit HflK